jgi:Ca2+-binding RTX toxin-like protein
MTINPFPRLPFPSLDPLVDGTTGTGLDAAVRLVASDYGLAFRLTGSEIEGGAAAADALNVLILDALRATGSANDGDISTADVHAISGWIRANRLPAFVALHGNDEDGVETGFHLVQNDGAVLRLFGEAAVDTVLDGLYHIGFAVSGDRFANEDGNANARVEEVAFWLGAFLAGDLAEGRLANPAVGPFVAGTTGTGLDRLIDLIAGDDGLEAQLSRTEIVAGARAADGMNRMIVEAIRATGIAADGAISELELHDVNAWLRANRLAQFTALHGDDGMGVETGFHLVQNDGGAGYLWGEKIVDTIADGLYHIAFDTRWGRFANEDGDANARLADVADWLSLFLAADLAAGRLAPTTPAPTWASVAGDLVFAAPQVTVGPSGGWFDAGNRPAFRLAEATVSFTFVANAPDSGSWQTLFSRDGKGNQAGDMWLVLHEGKLSLGVEDGRGGGFWTELPDIAIAAGESHDIALSFGTQGLSLYLDGTRVDIDPDFATGWASSARGLVIGGSTGSRDAANPTVVYSPFDGTISQFRLFDRALSAREVAILGTSGPLEGPAPGPAAVAGALPAVHRGTGLTVEVHDRAGAFANIQDLIAQTVTQASPTHRFTASHIDFGAPRGELTLGDFVAGAARPATGAATEMSTIGLRVTGHVWLDAGPHLITVKSDDGFLLQLGGQTVAHHDYGRGFEATTVRVDVPAGLYALTLYYFENSGDQGLQLRIDGEIAGPERFWATPADYQAALADAGAMPAGGLAPEAAPPLGTTGTGLDQILDMIAADAGLQHNVGAADMARALAAADAINHLIVAALAATRAGADGVITTAETGRIADWIRLNHYQAFLAAHGDDEDGVETGFHLVQNDGAVTRLFAENAVNTVFDGLYHIGFDIRNGRFANEDGDANARVEEVAFWLNALLSQDLGNASPALGGAATGPGVGPQGSAAAPHVLASAAPVTRLAEGAVSLTLAAGGSAQHGFGNAGANRMVGNQAGNLFDGGSGHDRLDGGEGDDTLIGGAGNDTLIGGWGDDTYVIDGPGDVTGEANGQGIDTLVVTGGYTALTLANGFEHLQATAPELAAVTGNVWSNRIETDRGATVVRAGVGNDTVAAGQGNDTLHGEAGNDELDGGTGNDVMAGGTGWDVYHVDSAGDRTVEADGGGHDHVHAWGIDWALSAEVEALSLHGMGGYRGTGNALDNVITGSAGNDTLDGWRGIDRMEGGAGNDVYAVSETLDRVVEEMGGGIDTVFAAVSWTLAPWVEHGVAAGTGAVGLQGNGLGNALTGNAAANALWGMAGADTLRGGEGADVLSGGAGADALFGGRGADRFVFTAADAGAGMAARDWLWDLSAAEGDRIDLSAVDAVAGGADDAFVLVGQLGGAAGRLAVSAQGANWLVEGDMTGDGVADLSFLVIGVRPMAADFVL